MKENYWLCRSEKRIYHSKPCFISVQDRQIMLSLGITEREKWVQITGLGAQILARKWKPHFVFSAYTTAQYTIIDCPELLAYQKSQNLEGNYIPCIRLKTFLDKNTL